MAKKFKLLFLSTSIIDTLFFVLIRVQWYCHFDDDIYVNVRELSNLLSKYDPTKPYYIGRYPRPVGVPVSYIVTTVIRFNCIWSCWWMHGS